MLIQSVLSLQETSAVVIQKFKDDAYKTKEEELRNYVSLAIKTVESYHARTSKEKIKSEVQAYLKNQTDFMLSIMQGEYDKYQGKVSDEQLKDIIKNAVKSAKYGETGYFWINTLDATIVMHPTNSSLDGKDMSDYKDQNGKRIFFEFAQIAKQQGDGFVDYVGQNQDLTNLKIKFRTLNFLNHTIG